MLSWSSLGPLLSPSPVQAWNGRNDSPLGVVEVTNGMQEALGKDGPEPPGLEAAGRGELCRGIPGAWCLAPASLRMVCPDSGLAAGLARGSEQCSSGQVS